MFRIAGFIMLLLAGNALAGGPPIGSVKTVTGEATITTDNQKINAQVGSPEIGRAHV